MGEGLTSANLRLRNDLNSISLAACLGAKASSPSQPSEGVGLDSLAGGPSFCRPCYCRRDGKPGHLKPPFPSFYSSTSVVLVAVSFRIGRPLGCPPVTTVSRLRRQSDCGCPMWRSSQNRPCLAQSSHHVDAVASSACVDSGFYFAWPNDEVSTLGGWLVPLPETGLCLPYRRG